MKCQVSRPTIFRRAARNAHIREVGAHRSVEKILNRPRQRRLALLLDRGKDRLAHALLCCPAREVQHETSLGSRVYFREKHITLPDATNDVPFHEPTSSKAYASRYTRSMIRRPSRPPQSISMTLAVELKCNTQLDVLLDFPLQPNRRGFVNRSPLDAQPQLIKPTVVNVSGNTPRNRLLHRLLVHLLKGAEIAILADHGLVEKLK